MTSIGEHLRTLRSRQGWTLDTLAKRAGLSKGFVSKIENGLSQPPIATLTRIADALGADMSQLFDGPRPNGTPAAVLTRRAERVRVERSRERPYGFERLAVRSPFRLTPYVIELDSDDDAPHSYQHAGEELVLVLEGELHYAAGGRIFHLHEGDTLVFDASLPHGPIKLPGKHARYLAVFTGEAAARKRAKKRRANVS
jgi:transcriptional regulator with XRE-family HTH domain